MKELRWAISIFLAFLVHGVVLTGLFFWHPRFHRPIIYSPSFSVGLYARVPQAPGPARTRKAAVKKPKAPVRPRPRPQTPSKPKRLEKHAWKVKEKKPLRRATKKAKAARRTVKKESREKKTRKALKGAARKVEAVRARALLARALAKVGKEVSMGGGVSRESVELRYKAYYDEIWRRVKASWILPEEVVTTGEDLLTVVVIRIGRDGELLKMSLEESSGSRLYDQSCLRAVKKAAPFPPLPRDYPQKYMELGLRFRPWE